MNTINAAFVCLEAIVLILALYLLLLIAYQNTGDKTTAVDALAIIMSSFAALVRVYRIRVLSPHGGNQDQTPSTRAVFALSGCFLTVS